MSKTSGMVPFFDERGRPLGAASKCAVHAAGGLWHRTILLLVARGGEVLCARRHAMQSFPDRLDTLVGGHEDTADAGSLLRCLGRETEEELVLSPPGVRSALLSERCFRPLGSLRLDTPGNRELSQLWGLRLPSFVGIGARDTLDDGSPVELEVLSLSLSRLEGLFARDRDAIADGLGRILAAMADDLGFRMSVYDFVEGGPWRICFACTTPAEPGCGCPDNDFYAVHEFAGPYAGADRLARELSLYYGGYLFWIEPANARADAPPPSGGE